LLNMSVLLLLDSLPPASWVTGQPSGAERRPRRLFPR
jgi:hypothetical protein